MNHLTDDLRSFHLSDRAKQEYIKGQAQFQTALGNFNKNQPNGACNSRLGWTYWCMLLSDNFPNEFATARAKLAAAAAELDIIIAPFVNVCKVAAHSGQFEIQSMCADGLTGCSQEQKKDDIGRCFKRFYRFRATEPFYTVAGAAKCAGGSAD